MGKRGGAMGRQQILKPGLICARFVPPEQIVRDVLFCANLLLEAAPAMHWILELSEPCYMQNPVTAIKRVEMLGKIA
jgi:hypothetical protein